ncbi:MAG: copper resistance protein CopC [Propionibacteriaceae bacterium]|jgi:methionine-rich copper-binding protein CopC|nr:copper resistance protein CopC [Propionibacteriaceae bacterium]
MQIRQRILSFIAAGILVSLACPSAYANELVVSDPEPHSETTERPGWVTLSFDESVEQDVVKILVLDQQGRNRAVGDLVYMGSAVMMQLDNDLPKGTYTVEYRIDRADGQTQGGTYQFAYGKGKWSAPERSTWSGDDEEPPVFEEKGESLPPSSASPSPTPSAVDTESAAPTVSESGISASPAPSLDPDDPDGDKSGFPVWILVGACVAAAAVAVVVVIVRAHLVKQPPGE